MFSLECTTNRTLKQQYNRSECKEEQHTLHDNNIEHTHVFPIKKRKPTNTCMSPRKHALFSLFAAACRHSSAFSLIVQVRALSCLLSFDRCVAVQYCACLDLWQMQAGFRAWSWVGAGKRWWETCDIKLDNGNHTSCLSLIFSQCSSSRCQTSGEIERLRALALSARPLLIHQA